MKHSKDSLIRQLKKFNETHNKIPSSVDCNRYPNELANYKVFEYHFGSWGKALDASELSRYTPPPSATIDIPCPVCGTVTQITNKQKYYSIRKKHFCSGACKELHMKETKMRKRSRIELFIERHVVPTHPHLLFNDRGMIGMELDIFCPHRNIAIELNGPHHYKPIHGIDVLTRIQCRDRRRAALCRDRGIQLVVIDVSEMQTTKQQRDLLNQVLDVLRG